MKKVRTVLITGPGFQDEEVMYPYYRLQEEGWIVDVITSTDTLVRGKLGWSIAPTLSIAQLATETFDAVVIPGGHEAPDRVRQVEAIIQFIQQMDRDKKVISSTCHGPWVLVEADIVKGKHITCYPAIKTDVTNAGALYEASSVVVDENLVTSDHPRNVAPWMKETIRLLQSKLK